MNADEIAGVFNSAFAGHYQTVIRGGAGEPLFQPRMTGTVDVALNHHDVIYFREDFASSALHEIAHWCIASARRRKMIDYGYWYSAMRDPTQQTLFEQAEARPQALEWIFARAAEVPFRISCDNFDQSAINPEAFGDRVRQAVRGWLDRGLSPRADEFARRLSKVTGVTDFFDPDSWLPVQAEC